MRRRIFASLSIGFLLISSLVYPAYADVITQFDGTPIPGVTNFLNNLGIPNVPASETVAEFFTVPGTSGTTSLTFKVDVDLGSFNYSFGYCKLSDVSADPITQKQLFFTQCIGTGTEVFNDILVNVGATSMQSINAGEVLIFWIIPNNSRVNFLANPSSFFPSQTANAGLRSPMASVANANPGQFDQMLSFVGGGKTAFTWEDLTRAGSSDNSFTDLGFDIDAQLMPNNDPCDGTDNNGNGIVDEGAIGVDDNGNNAIDEAGEVCPPLPPPPGNQGVGGELLPIDITALLLAGIQSSTIWMLPALAGIVGAGAFFVLTRMNKE